MQCVGTPIMTRCSPRILVRINQTLIDDPKHAIHAVGFSSLLDLYCEVLPRSFLVDLLDLFDPDACSIRLTYGAYHMITVEDIVGVLGLDSSKHPVPTSLATSSESRVSREFQIGLGGISISTLEEIIRSGAVDDRFKRAYVLLCLASFLCPTSKDVAEPRLYAAVDVVDIIHAYNWPAFVLDWLTTRVKKFKHCTAKSGQQTRTSIGGCLFLLMIIYFQDTPMGMDEGLVGSTLRFWTTDRIKERLTLESRAESHIPSYHLLRHPTTQAMYLSFLNKEVPRLCQEQMEHLRRIDAMLMGEGRVTDA